MNGRTQDLRFPLYALAVHAAIALLLIVSPKPKSIDIAPSRSFHSVMLAHLASPTRPMPTLPAVAPAPTPAPAPHPIPTVVTPPAPIHGATGRVRESTAASPHPADYASAPVLGQKSKDRVVMHPKVRAGVAIDRRQAAQELQEIAQEAASLDAQAKKAAQDAEERAQAAQIAAQKQDAENQALVQRYQQRIIALIHDHWQEPLCARPDMLIVLRLQLLPDGSIVSSLPLQPNACLSLSVQSALGSIDRLPVPSDPVLFERYFRSFKLRFTPNDEP